MTQEALKLALDFIEKVNKDGWILADFEPQMYSTIAAIKEALAQPEQEPLEYWNAVEGWVKIDEVREHFDSVGCGTIYKSAGEGRAPLYTTPPQRTWVDVPDEEIKRLWIQYRAALPRYLCFAKALLARSKEKNT